MVLGKTSFDYDPRPSMDVNPGTLMPGEIDEMIKAITAKEKQLMGHAERIIREQEGLEDALNGAFISNMVRSSRIRDPLGSVL